MILLQYQLFDSWILLDALVQFPTISKKCYLWLWDMLTFKITTLQLKTTSCSNLETGINHSCFSFKVWNKKQTNLRKMKVSFRQSKTVKKEYERERGKIETESVYVCKCQLDKCISQALFVWLKFHLINLISDYHTSKRRTRTWTWN